MGSVRGGGLVYGGIIHDLLQNCALFHNLFTEGAAGRKTRQGKELSQPTT